VLRHSLQNDLGASGTIAWGAPDFVPKDTDDAGGSPLRPSNGLFFKPEAIKEDPDFDPLDLSPLLP